jgi:hypothetical protein
MYITLIDRKQNGIELRDLYLIYTSVIEYICIYKIYNKLNTYNIFPSLFAIN